MSDFLIYLTALLFVLGTLGCWQLHGVTVDLRRNRQADMRVPALVLISMSLITCVLGFSMAMAVTR